MGGDPLYLLKMSVKNKTWEGAKQSLLAVSPAKWAYKGGRVSDEETELMFNRLYKDYHGETMYDERYMGNSTRLSDLSTEHNNEAETLFVRHLAGWKEKQIS